MKLSSLWKRSTGPETWLDRLGREYGNYSRPPQAYAMTTDNELQLVETYAREQFTGQGRIVDLGCWYGATTLALARGLSANRRATANRTIEAFDLFEWYEWMDPIAQYVNVPRQYAPGESFYDDVQELLRPYGDLVIVRKQDLSVYVPPPLPVEFLFVDAMKSWGLAQSIVSNFFPLLIAGTSYVVMQDFAYYYPQIATNHLIMWYLRDYFQWVHHVPGSCSVVFRCIRQPEKSALPLFTPRLFTEEMIEEAYQYSATCVSKDMHVMLEFAKLTFLIEQGDRFADAIRRQLKRVAASQATAPMVAELRAVAERSASLGLLAEGLRAEIEEHARSLATRQ